MENRIEILRRITIPLVKWYQKNARSLPWREDGSPYAIWVSEIMLQQTRIEAVKKYYERFMKKLPTIKALAEVEEEKLLKLWEGLGYYNRVRNMQKAANIMMRDFQGEMPQKYEELRKLPGIGEYTAGAIASIAYHEKVTAVDGNVLRVVSRVLGSQKDILLPKTKKEMTNLLVQVLPEEVGDFNEGLMELGELICIPNGAPFCTDCPLQEICIAKHENLTAEIPVRISKIKRKVEDRTVFLLKYEDKIAISKRAEKGLLAGMYELPNVLQKKKKEELKEVLKVWNLESKKIENLGETIHIFSHIEWHMVGYLVEVKQKNEEFLWISKKGLETKYALPSAFTYYKMNA